MNNPKKYKLVSCLNINLLRPISSRFLSFKLVLIFVFISTSILAQTVETDKLDYAPGETVQISGTGFLPGEIVVLKIEHIEPNLPVPFHSHEPWSIISDENGQIFSTWYVDTPELNTTLLLTATGQISGKTASTIFTDASTITISVTSGSNPTCLGSSITFTVVKQGGGCTPNYQWRKNGIDISGQTGTTFTSSSLIEGDVITCYQSVGSNGCSANESNSITISLITEAVSVSGGGIQCGGSMTLTASGGSGGTIYYQGTTSGGTSTSTPSTSEIITTSGTYYFRSYSSSGGCWGPEGSATVTINALPSTPTSLTATPATICNGQSATLSATVGGGETVDWFTGSCGGTPVTSPVSPSATTTYYARARNTTSGCVSAACATVTVTVDPVSVGGSISGGSSPVCSGSSTGTMTLSGYTGTIQAWELSQNGGAWGSMGGGNSSTFSQNTWNSGTWEYRVSVKSGSCPVAYSTIRTITVDALTVGGTLGKSHYDPVCEGTITPTLTLSGYTGSITRWEKRLDSGSWTNISHTADTYSETPTGTGTWEYRVLLQSGVCSEAYSSSISVTVVALPTVSILGSDQICVDETTQLSPSSGGSWVSNNNTVATVTTPSGVVTGVSVGSATFTFTTYYPVCSATTSAVTVLAIPEAVSVTGDGTYCGSTTITASGGSGGTIYFQGTTTGGISTDVLSSSESVTSSGIYYFRSYSTSSGCWGSEVSATVTINALPVVSISGSSTINVGETTQLSPNSGGSWVSNNSAVATVLEWNGLVTGISAGTATFTYTAYYPVCSATTSDLTVNSSTPTPTADNNGPVCAGSTLSLTASDITGATYSWSGPNGFSSTSQNPTVSSNATAAMAGTYSVTATVGGSTSSPGTTDVTVNAIPSTPSSPTASPTTICEGESSTLSASVGGDEVVDWFTGSCGGTAVTSPVSPSSTTAYYAQARNTTSDCVSASCASVTVTVNLKSADPTSATASSTTICDGQSTTLTLNGGGGGTGETIQWYSGSCGGTSVGTGNDLSVSPTTTTDYYGRYEDGAPCSYNSACSSVTITVNEIINALVELESSSPACPQLANGFNPDNDDHQLGETEVIFKVTRQYSTANWSFNYQVLVTNSAVSSDTPDPAIGSFSGSENPVLLNFYINNLENIPIDVSFEITDVTDSNCCETITSDNNASIHISEMPALGPFE